MKNNHEIDLYDIYYKKLSQVWDNDNQVKNKTVGLMTLLAVLLAFILKFEINDSYGLVQKTMLFLSVGLLIISIYSCLIILTAKKYEGYRIDGKEINRRVKEKGIGAVYKELNQVTTSVTKNLKKVLSFNQLMFKLSLLTFYWGLGYTLLVILSKLLIQEKYFLTVGSLIVYLGSYYLTKGRKK